MSIGPTPASRLTSPSTLDLSAAERGTLAQTGADFTEAKEAIVEGLVQLTVAKCTGAGAEGEFIYGAKPAAKLVSGFLLPRLDASGFDDETSDIHIATMGIDLQVAASEACRLTVRPNFVIYVRVLPTWAEICDSRYDLAPRSELSRQTRQAVVARARQLIAEEVARLPPLDEPIEIDERPGDSIANAERARNAVDMADQTLTESGGTDVEARGEAAAARHALEQQERIAQARQVTIQQRREARRQRNAAVSDIRRRAFDTAFEELNIQVAARSGAASSTRTLSASDLRSDGDQSPEANVASASPQTDGGAVQPADGTADEIAAGVSLAVRSDAGILDDTVAERQPIPMKWRRFSLDLERVAFDAASATERAAASAAFEATVLAQAAAVLTSWLATPEGQREAYRPNETILPSNFSTENGWNRYLDDLRARRPAVLPDVLPDLTGVTLELEAAPDYVDSSRLNLRVAIENAAYAPQRFNDFESSLFQVELTVTLPAEQHRPLRMDRVQPSYRFTEWLTYPAMGLNCGVRLLSSAFDEVRLNTTWAPQYFQPRIEPTSIHRLPTRYADLADPGCDIERLQLISDHYDAWIESQLRVDAGEGLDGEFASRERQQHGRDIEAYQRESRYVRAGVQLLIESRDAARPSMASAPLGTWSARDKRAAPYEAWLLANEAFALYGRGRFTDWRLFQLAFILAHIPTVASRMPEFERWFDADRDELTASLLYFATGGGKSEAFFGLLVFNVFLDRLRGKLRGVTALVRYPLRLLTLQQARRLTRILTNAELVRLRRRVPGAPFEIGFWVGSGNTPNRAAQGFVGVPAVTAGAHLDDSALLNPPTGDTESARTARRRSERYMETLQSYDKLRVCPCCGSTTGMRRYGAQAGRIGIVCFNSDCDWNRENPPAPHRVPLPFILTDDTIYQRAPAVVLGTVDKLALIGQHDKTINAIVGMLGVARFIDPSSGHLYVPRGAPALDKARDDGWSTLRPAFSDGRTVFHDPFPSLIIQDEGHLLEESLGTFSGLFETALEAILTSLGSTILADTVATWRPDSNSTARRPRLAKVIAATATISDPDRQLRVLYQREPLRFPCPGPNLYESFYAIPRVSPRAQRRELAEASQGRDRTERTAPRMRTYVSLMTNGRSHTMTTSAVVSAYHTSFTRLWRLAAEQGDARAAVAQLSAALNAADALSDLRRRALESLVREETGSSEFVALLDLQRISLTYVTNKKGGDQIIETLQAQVERDQQEQGIVDLPFGMDLISGGVTVAEIQDIMQRAEGVTAAGQPYAPLGESLRNIVATSAISHGVDVDKFNAMFFAGLPSDIAEYIQASSRVGRTHVGFSMLIPTPHSRRDRYVVETHDQFHRFLERMIPPPAVQRWADRAIRRTIPSLLQAYLCGVVEQIAFARASGTKEEARPFNTAARIKFWADRHAGGHAGAIEAVAGFVLQAIGLDGRGERHIGAATHDDHYRQFVEDQVRDVLRMFTAGTDNSKLSNFWELTQSTDIRKPMTSLRDIDAGGTIVGAMRDPWRRRNVNLEATRQIMRIIRGQRTTARADVDPDPAPLNAED